MKLKKITIITGLFLSLVFAPALFSQDANALPNPGLTPDSPFYFLETLTERISLAFTFNPEAKIRKQVDISQKKLAEAKLMAEQGKEKAAEIAVNRYDQLVSAAAENLAQAAQDGEGFADSLAELLAVSTAISQEVLAGVYEQVPEEAKPAIERAMQVSTQGRERAMEAISNTQREEVQQRIEENLQRRREAAPIDIPGEGEEGPEEAPVELPDQAPVIDPGRPETELPDQGGQGDQEGGSAPIDFPAGGGRP